MGGAILGDGSGYWQLLLCAAVGLALGVAVLATVYLAPLLRLRLAVNEEGRARVLAGELGRLRRLRDAAAVLEEHGRSSEAGELRAEAELRSLLLARAVGHTGGGARG